MWSENIIPIGEQALLPEARIVLGQLFSSYGLIPDSSSSTDTPKFNMADPEFPSAVDAIGEIAVQIDN